MPFRAPVHVSGHVCVGNIGGQLFPSVEGSVVGFINSVELVDALVVRYARKHGSIGGNFFSSVESDLVCFTAMANPRVGSIFVPADNL